MRVTVRLFARLKDIAGAPELERDVPADATLADVWAQLAQGLSGDGPVPRYRCRARGTPSTRAWPTSSPMATRSRFCPRYRGDNGRKHLNAGLKPRRHSTKEHPRAPDSTREHPIPVISDKLKSVETRYNELATLLADPAVQSDAAKYRENAKALSELEPLVEKYREFVAVDQQLTEAQELLRGSDAEMAALAKEELKDLEPRHETLQAEIKVLLLPKDPNDEKNVLLEIRAGTGGDEAALFAGELYRMYSRYCEREGWKLDVMSLSDSVGGGVKEAIASIEGKGVYSRLKYESGVHRVQRVPATEASGRIHTSTATVAVLPEAEEVDIQILDKDVRIDTFCSSGPGGQSVNTTYSAIRLTHLPSGLVVSQQDEKSQIKNRQKAFKVLRARLYELEMRKQQDAIAKDRKSQVGMGDRSEKIRTYNYPQSRITDHRINFTTHQLFGVLNGDLDELLDAVISYYTAEQLKDAVRSVSLWQAVVAARERFIRAGIPPDQAAIDAEVLARHARGWDRATYLTRRDEATAPADAEAYDALVTRRERREPVAYITGVREFWNLEFAVTPAVLIPRPESEFIIEAALSRMRDTNRRWAIADIGTGSGCLAITLAHERPAAASDRHGHLAGGVGSGQRECPAPGRGRSGDLRADVAARRRAGSVRSDSGQPSLRAGIAPADPEPGRTGSRAGRRLVRQRGRRPGSGAGAPGAGALTPHTERRAVDGVRVLAR